MSKTVINYSLSVSDINRAIREVEKFKREFLKKKEQFMNGLAMIGVKEASVRFTTAIYDGVNDAEVTLDKTDNGYRITANGQAVAFIEFGAGVYHNPSEPYPEPRPAGIVGIGEYGLGKGKQKAWGFKDESGEVVITRGNPASMPMWYASTEMKNSILKVAREVFG